LLVPVANKTFVAPIPEEKKNVAQMDHEHLALRPVLKKT
jgi:hypothetical protein